MYSIDINKAKNARNLLNQLERLSKVKKSFNTEHSVFWELVNTELKEQFFIPYFLKDKFKEAINESIKEVKQQIKKL